MKLANFKAWRDTGSIRLAPITVFFGSNSSGKSSVNQFLLLLKQTAQSPDRKRVLHFGDKTTPVDLGTFRDIVYNHAEEETVSFQIEWKLSHTMSVQDVKAGSDFFGDSVLFSGEVGLAGKKKHDVVVHQMAYRLGDLSTTGMEVGMKREEPAKKASYELTYSHYSAVRNPGRPWSLPPPTRFYGFPDEVIAYYQNAGFVQDFALALEKTFQQLYYLGPLREYPQRSYMWSGEIPEDAGWRGERAINAILAARDRLISPGKRQKKLQFELMIARWLKQMDLIGTFKVEQVGENRREYEVQVRTANAKQMVNVTDVGFGVSQVLPVLVECFYAPSGSTIIMEQPELHLHPSVQSSLADLFIEVIQAREEGKPRDIQLLIESHSEHFLRRLQRRIAEEQIKPEDAAIYFCRNTPEGSTIELLEVDACGSIQNWPEKFFGDDVGDLVAMTEAAMRRQKEAR